MSTRETILRSWWAAARMADSSGAVVLTAASFAGYALSAVDGDAALAHGLVPTEASPFWARVHDAIDQVLAEESKPAAASASEESTGDREDFADEYARGAAE